jgi:hypothetical protein
MWKMTNDELIEIAQKFPNFYSHDIGRTAVAEVCRRLLVALEELDILRPHDLLDAELIRAFGADEDYGFMDSKGAEMEKTKISVYMEFGVVFEYEVDTVERAREHASAIMQTGYRHTPKDSNDLDWYPPHRIAKIRVSGGGESSNYRDSARAT